MSSTLCGADSRWRALMAATRAETASWKRTDGRRAHTSCLVSQKASKSCRVVWKRRASSWSATWARRTRCRGERSNALCDGVNREASRPMPVTAVSTWASESDPTVTRVQWSEAVSLRMRASASASKARQARTTRMPGCAAASSTRSATASKVSGMRPEAMLTASSWSTKRTQGRPSATAPKAPTGDIGRPTRCPSSWVEPKGPRRSRRNARTGVAASSRAVKVWCSTALFPPPAAPVSNTSRRVPSLTSATRQTASSRGIVGRNNVRSILAAHRRVTVLTVSETATASARTTPRSPYGARRVVRAAASSVVPRLSSRTWPRASAARRPGAPARTCSARTALVCTRSRSSCHSTLNSLNILQAVRVEP